MKKIGMLFIVISSCIPFKNKESSKSVGYLDNISMCVYSSKPAKNNSAHQIFVDESQNRIIISDTISYLIQDSSYYLLFVLNYKNPKKSGEYDIFHKDTISKMNLYLSSPAQIITLNNNILQNFRDENKLNFAHHMNSTPYETLDLFIKKYNDLASGRSLLNYLGLNGIDFYIKIPKDIPKSMINIPLNMELTITFGSGRKITAIKKIRVS